MHAEIRTIRDPNLRVRIVEERMNFDQYPETWFEKYEKEQFLHKLSHRVKQDENVSFQENAKVKYYLF